MCSVCSVFFVPCCFSPLLFSSGLDTPLSLRSSSLLHFSFPPLSVPPSVPSTFVHFLLLNTYGRNDHDRCDNSTHVNQNMLSCNSINDFSTHNSLLCEICSSPRVSSRVPSLLLSLFFSSSPSVPFLDHCWSLCFDSVNRSEIDLFSEFCYSCLPKRREVQKSTEKRREEKDTFRGKTQKR